ncbi:MAG TPA: PQQ-binding-like beta-propeller repeat protein [Steroidobacteraceae bacterium]|nr:PQQ-binding-like beta-propeller repeat protein [Steroidobacteraceae bacterium]
MHTTTRLLSLGLAGIGLTALLAFSGAAGAQPASTAPGAAPGTAAPAAAPAPRPSANRGMSAGTEVGFGIFQNTCLKCHGNASFPQAPAPSVLRSYSPERIYDALTTGVMKAVGSTLTDDQRRLVAQAVAGRLLGSAAQGDAASMPNRCATNPPMKAPSAGPSWIGWGNNIDNTRFQPASAAGLTAADLPRLRLKWAFGLPNSTSAYSQPTVASGRVFVGSDTGYVYSLNAKTGCVYWSFLADAGVRNALTIESLTVHGHRRDVAFFGDLKANVYGVDARTGEKLWSTHVEQQYTDRVTAPPAYYRGKLFVPISSWEEFSAASRDYSCCTSVGEIVAVDAHDGKMLWHTYVIPERPTPTRKNSHEVQQYAPAGGSVWNTPAVDPKRNAIYFGTGDATTAPAAKTSDAVMALDMTTGKMLWSYQVTSGDTFLGGCFGDARTDNCPPSEGPDWDIPASPILATLPNGHRLIVVGTKPGDVLAFDPDRKGELVWRTNVTGKLAQRLPFGPAAFRQTGIQWGGAVYDDTVYYGLKTNGGLAAIQIPTGRRLWQVPIKTGSGSAGGPPVGHDSPATAIPGVVFLGSSDGTIVAASTTDGHVLWTYRTAHAFDTVNKVAAHGGSMGSQGITVAGGMVFAGSGYSVLQSGAAISGNVVLAFGLP